MFRPVSWWLSASPVRPFVTPFTICGRCLAPSIPLVATELFWRSGFNNEKLLETGAICMIRLYCGVLLMPSSQTLIFTLRVESDDMWKVSTLEEKRMEMYGRRRTVLIQNMAHFSRGINCRVLSSASEIIYVWHPRRATLAFVVAAPTRPAHGI